MAVVIGIVANTRDEDNVSIRVIASGKNKFVAGDAAIGFYPSQEEDEAKYFYLHKMSNEDVGNGTKAEFLVNTQPFESFLVRDGKTKYNARFVSASNPAARGKSAPFSFAKKPIKATLTTKFEGENILVSVKAQDCKIDEKDYIGLYKAEANTKTHINFLVTAKVSDITDDGFSCKALLDKINNNLRDEVTNYDVRYVCSDKHYIAGQSTSFTLKKAAGKAAESVDDPKLGQIVSAELGIGVINMKKDEAALAQKSGVKDAVGLLKNSQGGRLGDNWKARADVATAISGFFTTAPMEMRALTLVPLLPDIFDIITTSILFANDEGVPDADYSKMGKQMVASNLLNGIGAGCKLVDEIGVACYDLLVPVLNKIADAKPALKEPNAMKSEGAAIERTKSLKVLIGLTPKQGTKCNPPDNIASTLARFVSDDTANWIVPKMIKDYAMQTISNLAVSHPKAMEGQTRALFLMVKQGNTRLLTTINATRFQEDPDAYYENIDYIVNDMPFINSFAILYQISSKNPKILIPYVSKFIDMINVGVERSMEQSVLSLLQAIASVDPDSVYPHLNFLKEKTLTLPNCDAVLPNVIGNCGKAKVADACEVVTVMLCELLSNPNISKTAQPTILFNLSNQFTSLKGNTKILDPYINTIKSFQSSYSLLVEKILDYHAGRSLEDVSNRLDALEAKVAEMNNKVSQTCANFEDVKKYVDQNIAEVKDLMAEVTKRLPTPVRLTVVGGIQKTLILHFQCARTKEEVTTETKDWNKWVKIGFSAIALGKCIADVAIGNPMNIGSGLSAIKNIYTAYKSKDDKDFDTFVKEPFLTSEESDKLILQLRAAKFFEKMVYAPQIANWVVVSALTPEEAEKQGLVKEREAQILANKDKQKGLGIAATVGVIATGVVVGAAEFVAQNAYNNSSASTTVNNIETKSSKYITNVSGPSGGGSDGGDDDGGDDDGDDKTKKDKSKKKKKDETNSNSAAKPAKKKGGCILS